ncbi:MAG: hypothetical protein ACYDER_08125 [Ktedonobacteraceae bacterium]
MARKPKPLGRDTLAASVMDLALQHKAARLGVREYSIADLGRESEINHSVIFRAIKYQVLSTADENGAKKQPQLLTVKRMAQTLELALAPELETLFYNAFGYASPAQIAQVEAYFSHQKHP